jgi:hypothetical protein
MNLNSGGGTSNATYTIYWDTSTGGCDYNCYAIGDTYGEGIPEVKLSQRRYQELLEAERRLKRILLEQKYLEEQAIISRRWIEL